MFKLTIWSTYICKYLVGNNTGKYVSYEFFFSHFTFILMYIKRNDSIQCLFTSSFYTELLIYHCYKAYDINKCKRHQEVQVRTYLYL